MREVKLEELGLWLMNDITAEFQRRVLERFEHQQAILASSPGTSVDHLKGRAEVLAYIINPRLLFED